MAAAPKAKILDTNLNENDGSVEIELKVAGCRVDVIVKGGVILDIAPEHCSLCDLSEAAQALIDKTAEELAAKYK